MKRDWSDLDTLTSDLGGSPIYPLVAHWLDLFGRDNHVPRRRELDPLQFPRLLKHIWIFRADDDEDFSVSLSGETFTEWYGYNPTGKTLREICTPEVLTVLGSFSRCVVDVPCIVLHSVQSVIPNWHEPAKFTRIGLPLADTDGVVRYLIGATLFDKHYYNGMGAVSSTVCSEVRYRIPSGPRQGAALSRTADPNAVIA